MRSSGILRRMTLARTDVSEERSTSIIKQKKNELRGSYSANEIYRQTTASYRRNLVPTFVGRRVSRGQLRKRGVL
jgi:hypothetical protein